MKIKRIEPTSWTTRPLTPEPVKHGALVNLVKALLNINFLKYGVKKTF